MRSAQRQMELTLIGNQLSVLGNALRSREHNEHLIAFYAAVAEWLARRTLDHVDAAVSGRS